MCRIFRIINSTRPFEENGCFLRVQLPCDWEKHTEYLLYQTKFIQRSHSGYTSLSSDPTSCLILCSQGSTEPSHTCLSANVSGGAQPWIVTQVNPSKEHTDILLFCTFTGWISSHFQNHHREIFIYGLDSSRCLADLLNLFSQKAFLSHINTTHSLLNRGLFLPLYITVGLLFCFVAAVAQQFEQVQRVGSLITK